MLILFFLCSSMDAVLEEFFFFFQAEDGIRDVAVTGVQTCALPIWATVNPRASVQHNSRIEMSNDKLVTASHRPGGSCGMRSSIPAKKFITLPWEIGRASCRERV